MFGLSPALERINESPTVAISGRALALKKAGRDVISLSGGEPDFDTPDHIKLAAIEAIKSGETKYTPVDGTALLKAAIVRKFQRENGLDYSAAEISVGTGGKQVIFNALTATLQPGDEVIVVQPCWVSYPDIVSFSGGKPIMITGDASRQFKATAAQFEGAITPKTRWIILNSPCNPTGGVYSAAELAEIAAVLIRHPQILVLTDDIYEHLIYTQEKFATIARVAPELKDRTLTVNGVSKAYCMTGWRIGYAAGPAWLIRAMAKLQGQTTNNPASISQAAAAAALDGDAAFMERHRESYRRRRDLAATMINRIPGLSCDAPDGAFYLYVSIAGVIGKKAPKGQTIGDDLAFAEYLLEDAGVAIVPGAGFGLSPYIRIAYAIGDEDLREACSRIERACAALN